MLADKQSELMSDLLFTVHQHGGDDVTWKPPIHQRTLKEHIGHVSHTNAGIFENAYFYPDLWPLCWKAISKQYGFGVRIL